MKRTLLLLPALLLPASASADEALVELALEQVRTAPADGMVAPEAVELRARRVHRWAAGTDVRLAQSFRGLPVLDREVIVSFDLDGRVVATRGEALQAPLLPVAPALSAAEAEDRAEGFVRSAFGRGELWPTRSEPAIHVDEAGLAHLVWKVDTSTAAPVGAWRVLVDAHDGALHDFRPTMHTARGDIWPTNPVTSELTTVELEGVDDVLAGPFARVYSCDRYEEGRFGSGICREMSPHAEADEDGDFFYEPDAGDLWDPQAEVQMYYHLDLVGRWFDEELGFRHEGPGGLLVPVEGVVNVDYGNAFYGDIDGDRVYEVAFGQTRATDFAYDGDVIVHEYGHSVFGQVVSTTGFFGSDEYGMEWAPGGLNEGTADVFAMIRTGDPVIGEYAGRGFGMGANGVRDLEADRHCPTDLYGESHRDGEVWGAFHWNLIEDPRVGPDLLARLLYGALGRWPSDVNWEQAGASLVEVGELMLASGQMDQAAMDALLELGASSGVIGCGRVVRLDEGQEPTQLMVYPRFVGDDARIPLGQQYSLDAPAAAERIRLRVKGFEGGPPQLGYTVYVRRGEPVRHELMDFETPFGTIGAPVPTDFDFEFDGEGEDFEVNFDLVNDPRLEPGATYYFAISARLTGDIATFTARAEITVDGRLWVGDGPPPTEEDELAGQGQGCEGCSASPTAGPAAGGLLLLLPALASLRRRR